MVLLCCLQQYHTNTISQDIHPLEALSAVEYFNLSSSLILKRILRSPTPVIAKSLQLIRAVKRSDVKTFQGGLIPFEHWIIPVLNHRIYKSNQETLHQLFSVGYILAACTCIQSKLRERPRLTHPSSSQNSHHL